MPYGTSIRLSAPLGRFPKWRRPMVTDCPTRLQALMDCCVNSECHFANWGKNALQLDLQSMMTCSGA
eukprot:13945986-Alexandrium_andersonii.AAC.1